MTIEKLLKTGALGASLLLLAACASTDAAVTDTARTDATATSPSSAPEDGVQVAEADKGEMVCRREKVTGSNFKRKICYTAEQWEAMREEAKRSMDRLGQESGGGCFAGADC
ncbi:MAG: hypothetical protein WBA35_04755 [Litorimonas sp.]